ncbi:MAG: peroxiredoxin [Bradymonadia bacterium]
MRFLWILLFLVGTADARPHAPKPTEVRPILIGQRGPDATVLTPDGTPVQLAALMAEQPTVLVFLRGGWCYYCQKQLGQLRTIEAALNQTGYRIIAISGDAPAVLKAAPMVEGSYKVYSDQLGVAARAYGLSYLALAKHFGTPGNFRRWQKAHGTTRPWLPVPAVFLAHRSGLIVYEYVNVDFSVRLSGEVLLTAAQVYAEAK